MLFFAVFFLVCCGREEEIPSGPEKPSTEERELVIRTENAGFDISSEAEELFRIDYKERMGYYVFVGTQYYLGEPVQLWIEAVDREGRTMDQVYADMMSLTPEELDALAKDKTWLHRTIYRDLDVTANLYLYRPDGTRELLVADLISLDPHKPFSDIYKRSGYLFHEHADRVADYMDLCGWFVDRDGNCYCWWELDKGNYDSYTFMKISASGEVAYEVLLEPDVRVRRMFQLPDGSMYMMLRDEPRNEIRIVAFDSDTGERNGTDVAVDAPGSKGKKLNCGAGSLCGLDEEGRVYLYLRIRPQGIYEVNLTDGSVTPALSFDGTTYVTGDSTIKMTETGWLQGALRVCGDGSAEVLWYNTPWSGNYVAYGVRERIYPMEADRPAVTIRGEAFSAWVKAQAREFNRRNADWQVVLEEFAASNAVDLEEYARLTSVQLATGKGPDMFYGSFLDSYMSGMIEKGAVLNMTPWIDASGLCREAYLPLVFDVWRQGEEIYGITAEGGTPLLYTVDKRVLGGEEASDMASLVKGLLSCEEEGVLFGYDSQETILRSFLKGSEDLWGMVDWEYGSCDFGGALFADLLEAAKRYGYDERNKYPNLMRHVRLDGIYEYDSRSELNSEGYAVCGILFDDGCHGTVTSAHTFAINADSKAGNGAWEFLLFLLEENTQAKAATFPVKRSQLEAWIEQQIQRAEEDGITVDASYIDGGELVKERKTYTREDMTRERAAEYLEALEGIRAIPIRNAPILDIICEEALDYFNGTKSIRQVVKIIENRVGLYLSEQQ